MLLVVIWRIIAHIFCQRRERDEIDTIFDQVNFTFVEIFVHLDISAYYCFFFLNFSLTDILFIY